jgi:hypothetical protein
MAPLRPSLVQRVEYRGFGEISPAVEHPRFYPQLAEHTVCAVRDSHGPRIVNPSYLTAASDGRMSHLLLLPGLFWLPLCVLRLDSHRV